jgi:nucleotide-binding universal stress UspA family protein
MSGRMNDETHVPLVEKGDAPSPEFILVALDASPLSRAALLSAAELAATLQVELRGLFVEDEGLMHLAGLPFGVEFGSFTARPHRLDANNLEREFRIQAAGLRKIMADVAGQRRVTWSFQVVRGRVTDQVLAAGAEARLLYLGRVGRTPGKRLGSTARAVALRTQRPVLICAGDQSLHGPFLVVHTGSPAGDNAVALAVDLSGKDGSPMTVLFTGDAEGATALAARMVRPGGLDIRCIATQQALLAELHLADGAVVLPVDAAQLMEYTTVSVIVTP